MTEASDRRLVARCQAFASAAAVFGVMVGTSVLAGWALKLDFLATWGIAPVKMVANTATCFVLLGASALFLGAKGGPSARGMRTLASRVCAATASLVGCLSLTERLSGRDLGLDQLLVTVAGSDHAAGVRPGLMSWLTALDFLFLGLALLLLNWRRQKQWPAQFFCLGAAIPTAFGLLALILASDSFPTTMSWPTVVTFLVLESGLVCSRPEWAAGGFLVRKGEGARLLRRAVPASLLALGLVGVLVAKLLLRGARFNWIVASALALLCGGLLAGFLSWVSLLLDRSEDRQKKIKEAQSLSPEQLDQLLGRIERQEDDVQQRRRLTVGFALAALLTIGLGIGSWRVTQVAEEEAAWVSHTHEVLALLELSLRHLVDVETGARGFGATGEPVFLEPYLSGKPRFAQDLAALRVLIRDNASQQGRIDVLSRQAALRIAASDQIVAARRETGAAPTLAHMLRGKALMDAVRVTVEALEEEEKHLLTQREERTRRSQRAAIWVMLMGSLLGAVCLSIAGGFASRGADASALARAQVLALNADLERRVRERTLALGESEERLKGIIQSAMDSIITVDEGQMILLFNAAAEEMFRCPAADAVGHSLSRFIPARFHAVHAGHLQRFGETGVTNRAMSSNNVLWGVRADGEEFQIEASISQVVSGGKKLFTVILRDVTERTRAAQAREHLAAVVESSDDAMIGKDLHGIINAWNRGAEKIFGYSREEMLGQSMMRLFPPDRVEEEAEILARIQRGESVDHFETVRVRKDGMPIHVSATISPIRDSSGQIVGAAKVARDITERKQVEEALRQSDAGRRLALGAAKLGEWSVDLRTHKATHSLRHDEIFGYSSPPAEWNFEAFLSHVVTEDRSMVRHCFEQAARDGKNLEFECRIVCVNGELRWIRACGDRYDDGSGKADQVFGTVEDITERKQAEDALRDREERLRLAMDGARLGTWHLEFATGELMLSPLSYELLGVTPGKDVQGRALLNAVHPDDRQKVEDAVKRSIAEHAEYDVEYRVVWPDGRQRRIASRGRVFLDLSGEVVRMGGILFDVTDRYEAQVALRESEERFHAMLNGIPQLAWMAEPDGHIFWYNQRWYDYTGTTPEQMEGWGWQSVHHPEMLPKVLERWKDSVATGTLFEMEFPLRAANGCFGMFLTRVLPLRDADGNVVRWCGTNTDITALKDAEAALQEQSKVLDLAQVLVRDMESRIVLWNHGAEKLYGFTRHEAVGRVSHELLSTEFPQAIEQIGEQLRENDKWEGELRHRKRDGTCIIVSSLWVLHRDKHGQPLRILEASIDITARKQAETMLAQKSAELAQHAQELSLSRTELEKQTRMLRLVLDSMGEGLVAADLEGHSLIWNDSARKLLGRGPEEVETEQWSAHYACYFPDGTDPVPVDQLPLVRAMRGESLQTQLIVRNPNHEPGLLLEFTGRPMRDDEGGLCGGVVAFRDITEQNRAERALAGQAEELSRQAEELMRSQRALETQTLMLQSVLDSMVEGLSATDENGKLILWNQAAERILGPGAGHLTPEQRPQHFGTYLADTVTPLPHEQSPMSLALRGESNTVELFVRNALTPEGVWIEASGGPIKDKAGVLRGGVVAFRDITRRKIDEREILKLNDGLEIRVLERTAQLEAANRELESFSYSVSHDLRAPLRHIGGFSRMLVEEYGPALEPGAQHYLSRIHSGAQKMGLLVDELLNLARVGRHSLSRQPAPLDAVVAEVIEMLQPETEGREVRWAVGDLPTIECDPVLVKQVFQNLLTNALKFTRGRTPAVIEVGHTAEGGQTVFLVRDNGIGFSMKYVDKLFGVFQRLHRPEDYEGTGIGLATVQRIVQKHGGWVSAEGEVDQGATFCFTLSGARQAEGKTNGATAGGRL